MSGPQRLSTGIAGLDEVLGGGFPRERAYMVTGGAGTGKTILGLHFLTAGVDADENALFVAFEEDPEDLSADARQLGFDTGEIEFLDLSPDAEEFVIDDRYDVFEPDVVEGSGIADRIVEAVERTDPDRVFIDPLTYLQYLAPNEYQYRQEVAGLVQYLTDQDATVLFSSQAAIEGERRTLEYLCDGSLTVAQAENGRTIEVTKLRGSGFLSGAHTLEISGDGIDVFTRLVPDAHDRTHSTTTLSTGVEELDELLHGGIESSTVTVISGPSGVGKTTTASQLAVASAKASARAVTYLFEETRDTFVHRSESVGLPIEQLEADGTLSVEEVEPLRVSPDQFAHSVRREVEERDTQFVVIDGISGYRLSIRGEGDELIRELHALGRYLKRMGVTAVFIDDMKNVTGDFEPTSSNLSYLADNLLFLRYLEAYGELRKAIGVLKKRTGDFERTLREFGIRSDGIHVGEPLTGLRGILTGTPEWGADPVFDPRGSEDTAGPTDHHRRIEPSDRSESADPPE
ncbi:ATPase domain-containing protein [Halobellus captivus]|uniref:ATPase domain-containing protein n=1 Tax=Halobellus captivus TaxID=2592614 RepID=UPI0011A1E469|nr:ATPase domain-containing protein [Halobellus captivus]